MQIEQWMLKNIERSRLISIGNVTFSRKDNTVRPQETESCDEEEMPSSTEWIETASTIETDNTDVDDSHTDLREDAKGLWDDIVKKAFPRGIGNVRKV